MVKLTKSTHPPIADAVALMCVKAPPNGKAEALMLVWAPPIAPATLAGQITRFRPLITRMADQKVTYPPNVSAACQKMPMVPPIEEADSVKLCMQHSLRTQHA